MIEAKALPIEPEKATIHSIQLLRAIAAALVAVLHAHKAFALQVSQPWSAREAYLFEFGAVGVHIFFVISGFIMVVTSGDRGSYDAKAFFRRRLFRIYPIYWFCAVAYLVAHQAIGRPYRLSWEDIAGALTLWPGSASTIIGPAWTLSFEMYFYVCLGLALMLGLSRGLAVLGAGFGAAIVVGAILQPADGFAFVATNGLLAEFLAGSAIGWLTVRGRLPLRFGPALTGVALALFLAGIAAGYHSVPDVLSWGVPSAILVLGLVSWERRSGAARVVRLAGRLGDSSYVLYLIHVLLVTLAVEVALSIPGTTSLAPAFAAVVVGAAAVGIAHVLHLAVERPMLRWLNPRRALVPMRPSLVQ